jgi:hypothetical protein
MFNKKKPEIVLVIETFADGQFIKKSVKVLDDGPNWFRRVVLGIVIPYGFWIMVMEGMFR